MANLSNGKFKTGTTRTGEDNCLREMPSQVIQRLQDFFVKHTVVAQCYVAAMLSIVIAINIWKYLNITGHLIYASVDDSMLFSPLVKNWTSSTYRMYTYGSLGGEIFFQVPGALLIYITSSHKFLTAAVTISSILHMLTPLCVHSGTLAFMILAQRFITAPLEIAVLSMWKDWVPPGKRTIFVFISFSISILEFPFTFFLHYLHSLCVTNESLYITGACGLVWSLLWYFTVSDSPSGDSRFPENQQLSLQNHTFSEIKGRAKLQLSEVPWKRILKSMPVFALCLIFFKIGSSFMILVVVTYEIVHVLADSFGDIITCHLIFAVVYTVVFIIGAVLTDFLSRKFPSMMKIRKSTLSGALIIHAILLLGMLIPNLKFKVVIFCLSYFIFSSSLAGFFTNALDLSSRYVSIIFGFIETFYLFGYSLSHYYMNNINYSDEPPKEENLFGSILYYEIGFTILVAVIFQMWGSVQEQPWSVSTDSGHNYTNFQQNPEQELELKNLTVNT